MPPSRKELGSLPVNRLVEAFYAGVDSAADELVERLRAPLMRSLTRFCKNTDDAEEAFQQTVLKLWQTAISGYITAAIDAAGEIRLRAIESLGWLGDHRAVDPLVTIIADTRDTKAGEAAAESLSSVVGKIAVEPLMSALASTTHKKHGRAKARLTAISDKAMAEAFVEQVGKPDPDGKKSVSEFRRDLKLQMFKCVGSPIVARLMEAVRNADDDAMESAKATLRQFLEQCPTARKSDAKPFQVQCSEREFWGWIYRIAKNIAVSIHRKKHGTINFTSVSSKGEDGDFTSFVDQISANEASFVEKALLTAEMLQCFASLSEQEQAVIRAAFLSESPRTQVEISEELEMSTSKISRLKTNAIMKLRHGMECRRLSLMEPHDVYFKISKMAGKLQEEKAKRLPAKTNMALWGTRVEAWVPHATSEERLIDFILGVEDFAKTLGNKSEYTLEMLTRKVASELLGIAEEVKQKVIARLSNLIDQIESIDAPVQSIHDAKDWKTDRLIGLHLKLQDALFALPIDSFPEPEAEVSWLRS